MFIQLNFTRALVRERLKDWKKRFGKIMGKKVIELTGDVTPDIRSLQAADIILVPYLYFLANRTKDHSRKVGRYLKKLAAA